MFEGNNFADPPIGAGKKYIFVIICHLRTCDAGRKGQSLLEGESCLGGFAVDVQLCASSGRQPIPLAGTTYGSHLGVGFGELSNKRGRVERETKNADGGGRKQLIAVLVVEDITLLACWSAQASYFLIIVRFLIYLDAQISIHYYIISIIRHRYGSNISY